MSKVIEALRSAVEHRDRISLDDIDCANLLAEVDRLRAELAALKSHLEYECGDRCNAEYNPCWARKVLNALDTKPGECQHEWRCVNDGKHGREERWECRLCGEQEVRN